MKRKRNAAFIFALLVTVILMLASCGNGAQAEADRITVRIAAPQSAFIEDFDKNLYKLWLEEQTGLQIEMTWLPVREAEQVVKLALSTGENLHDAYIGFGNYDIFDGPNLQAYGEQGVILPLNTWIGSYGVYTRKLFAELPEYNIEALMTSADGNIYFMPGFSSSVITRHRQIMWVNKGWLNELRLRPPETTDEFHAMLRAFQSRYPDSFPMAGTGDHYGKQAYDFLINAFVYNDTENARLLLEDGNVGFAPVRDEWRDALIYIRGLYEDGLYSPFSFTQDDRQFRQMANDQRDILGAFVSPGITLTVYQNSPAMMERYTGIGPLKGPDGVKYSTLFTPIPRPNGVITSASRHPEEVFRLFDIMLSEEACLMGRYGEHGVDWDFAKDGDISIYGTPATISIINQLWNTPQNKHLSQIGPYVSRPKFSGGVTWDGNTTDGEYMNAQAAMLHRDFVPDEYITTLIFTPEEEARIQGIRDAIENHVVETVIAFITGARDVQDDAEWQKYLSEFANSGLAEFLKTAQTVWDRQAK